MAFCRNCGKEIDDKAVVCPHCGVPQSIAPSVEDNGGFLWGLLGCGVPIVGLVLYLVWRDTRPKTAKAVGKGALVAVVLWAVYYVIVIAFAALMIMIGAMGM